MTLRAPALALLLVSLALCAFGCVKPINDGAACFQTDECRSGSICAQTVYGKFCLLRCSVDTVRCGSGASCLRSEEVSIDPSDDGGMDGGIDGDAGTDADGGTDPDGGTDADGGADADAGTEEVIWTCLPGRLEIPGYLPRIIGQVCDVSLDCELGAVCVCIPGATCEGEGKNGPTCQRLCDPSILNQCPQVNDIQPQCTELGDGRGFCDPTTLSLPQ